MSAPGTRLRALARRFCNSQTMERLIDPVIADQQHEYADAIGRGDAWAARRARIAGCIAFWKVAFMTAGASMPKVITADGGAIGRTIRFAGIATTAVTAILVGLPLSANYAYVRNGMVDHTAVLLFGAYLVPQALALSMPMGLVFGILCGLRTRVPAAHTRRTIGAIAVATSIAATLVVCWLLPESNQAWRELVVGRYLARGINELPLRELARRSPYMFHQRLALSAAPLFLSAFSLALAPAARRGSAITAGFGAFVTCLAYYMLLFTGQMLAIGRAAFAPGYQMPGPLAAWTPNLLFAAAALLLHLRTHGRSGAGPSRLDDAPRSADRPAAPPA